jgi:hypothetical protein
LEFETGVETQPLVIITTSDRVLDSYSSEIDFSSSFPCSSLLGLTRRRKRERRGRLPADTEFGSVVRWELVVAFRAKFGLWTTWAVELKLFSFLIIWAVEAIIGSRPARRKILGPACISSHHGIVRLWKENQNLKNPLNL